MNLIADAWWVQHYFHQLYNRDSAPLVACCQYIITLMMTASYSEYVILELWVAYFTLLWCGLAQWSLQSASPWSHYALRESQPPANPSWRHCIWRRRGEEAESSGWISNISDQMALLLERKWERDWERERDLVIQGRRMSRTNPHQAHHACVVGASHQHQ